MDPVVVAVFDKPDPRVVDGLLHRLEGFNRRMAPQLEQQELVVVAHDHSQVFGGLIGYLSGGWLFIHVLWLAEDRRGQGIGRRLMQTAEAEAVRRGCHGAYTDTFTFQAPDFYEKLGYTAFARLEGFDGGQTRTWFRKDLVLDDPAQDDASG